MKKPCLFLGIFLACLIGAPLVAETIGNVTFQFPPSMHRWVLLSEFDLGKIMQLAGLEQEDSEEEESENGFAFKIYTHKIGDGLELFAAISVENDEGDEEDEDDSDFQDAAITENFINETMQSFFPNHRIIINTLNTTTNNQFVEWEVTDGVQTIVHGLSRSHKVGTTSAIFSYLTTVQKSYENSLLWTDALNEIKVVN